MTRRRRSAVVLSWLALAASGCADVPRVDTHPATVSSLPSPEPSLGPSTPPATPMSSTSAVTAWTGPVRSAPTSAETMDSEAGGRASSVDEHDAARDYVDIEAVSVGSVEQPHWRLSLSAAPPAASTLDSAETLISYGLAFETSGDDAPDYVVGISNGSSMAGRFRVWVTDLATGATEEQDGPPYGYPVEFVHPDERQPGDPADRQMLFTFLSGSGPPGVSLSTPFYAWASVEEEGMVVAWDYAPDEGWIRAPGEGAAAPEVPAPVPDPAVGGGHLECQARAFDFEGEGTLRALGLHEATPVTPPDIDRVGMIWVTRDLMPYDRGPEGGPIEMTRMLCFTFPDGSGGSGWPVDPAWQPPTDAAIASVDADSGTQPLPLLGLAVVALLVVGVSALAFRSRR